MKRLLILGNSHLVAVKAAWEAAAPQGFAVEFFGAPQRAWTRMTLLPDNRFGVAGDFKRQRQITEQANGKATVSLNHRDIIVLVGGFSAAEPIAELLALCDIPGLRATGAATLLSEPLFAKACAALAAAQLPESDLHTYAPVLMIPRPAPAETCLTSTNATYQHWHHIAAAPDGIATGFARFDAALTAAMAAKGLTYLPQPQATRTAIGLTHAHYLAPGGGTLQGEEKKRGDHAHMNQAYGAQVVAQLLNALP